MTTERGKRLRLEPCPHTKDKRRFPHGAPMKPKRYCDECIEDEIHTAERAERKACLLIVEEYHDRGDAWAIINQRGKS